MIKCPVCKKQFKNNAGFHRHARGHAQRGELVRKELPRVETSSAQHYAWRTPVKYVKVEA